MGDTEQKKLSKRSLFAIFIVLIIIPLTILAGVYCFGDKKYYFISLLIILEILLPFFILFEKKKPQARMLVLISVLCAVTVVGRIAFQWIPQFKPVLALVIIMGVAFGGETGFLTGAVTAFVSNFYFIQGAWTPWQMFCFGIVGFAAGVFYQKGFLKVNRLSLTIFGGLSTLVLYGGIMNPASILMFQPKPTLSMLIASYGMGFSFDLIHAGATMFFLWFASEPMLGKLERMKLKYGISFR